MSTRYGTDLDPQGYDLAQAVANHRERPTEKSHPHHCAHCYYPWPCPTIVLHRQLQAISGAPLALVPVEELYDHADGNVGDGCWSLHDKYASPSPAVTEPGSVPEPSTVDSGCSPLFFASGDVGRSAVAPHDHNGLGAAGA